MDASAARKTKETSVAFLTCPHLVAVTFVFCFFREGGDVESERTRFGLFGRLHLRRASPGLLAFLLIALEGFLYSSERFRWFAFGERKGWAVLIAAAIVVAVALMLGVWFAVALLFRWRIRFGLRWLILLVVAIPIPCAWLALRIRDAHLQRDAVVALDALDCSLEYGEQNGTGLIIDTLSIGTTYEGT